MPRESLVLLVISHVRADDAARDYPSTRKSTYGGGGWITE
jgi:hypothetical protein